MSINEYRKLNENELNKEIVHLLREQFNLKMQLPDGNVKKTHIFKQIRKKIAWVKTILVEDRKKYNE